MLPTTPCRACRRPVVFVRTKATGKMMPVDPEPNERGNVYVTRDPDTGQTLAVVLKKGEPPPIGTVFMPHYATCPVVLAKRGRR